KSASAWWYFSKRRYMLPRCMKASPRSSALPPGELISPVQAASTRSTDFGSSLTSATGIMHSPAETGRPKAARICAAFFGRADRLERVERRRELGRELERHIDRSERAGIVAECVHGLAALDIGQRILRLERDDLVEIGKRPEILPEQRQGRAAIDVAVD